ncbi:MAG: hypothetical protein JNK82_28475 [Myxococcaceae bacterium]|nr:hypothetical protein [Myxococcaceae bacterium]
MALSEKLRACAERLANRPGDPEAVSVLEGLLESPEEAAQAAQFLAPVYERRAEPARTLEAWLKVLLLFPDHAEARAAVRALSTPELQLSGAAVALCTELVAKSKGHAEAQALLDRVLPPTEALLQALNRLQESAEPAALLDGVYRAAQRADALDEVADAVEALSERHESPAQVTALLRFAARAREELKQPARAAQLWNDLLAGAPRDAEALEHLARLLAESGDARHAGELSVRRAELAPGGAVRLQYFAQAADHFLAAGAHEASLSALNEALRVAGPASDAALTARVQLGRGRLLERAGDPSAVGAYAAAIDDPATAPEAALGLERAIAKPLTRVPAAKALEAWARGQNDPKRLAAVLAVRAEGAASTEQHLELLVELAALYEQLGETRAALGALIRAFALAPADERVGPSLERLAYALGANEELLAAYEEHLERRPGDAAVARKTAQLHEALGNRDEAYAAFERAAEASPKDVKLLEAFAERARARGDLARLARALRWQADATIDPAARAKLLRSLAQLKEDSLADPAAAAHAWEEVRELQPDDAHVLATLVRLYEQTSHVAALSRVVARQLELARVKRDGVAQLALRLARLKLDAPTDEVGALALLREVLTLEPDNAQAVAALGRLASTPSPLQAEAVALAGAALDKLGDYPVIVQILEAQLATTPGAAQRAAILHRISDLQAGPLKDPDLAFLAITRALREAPHDAGVLARCVELADATGTGEELDALLAELGAAQAPGAARAGLFRALALRSNGDAAIAAWSEVLAQVPNDEPAREELARRFEAAGRLVDLAVLQRQRAENASPADRPKALLALAAAQERAGELDEAASTLLGLFALKPGVEALAPLDRVLAQLGRHSERAEVLRRLAAETTDVGQKVSRMVAQGRALISANERVQAVTVLGDVLARSPDEPRAVAELVTLVSDESAGERAAELLVGVFTAKGAERQRAAVLEALVVSPGARDPRELLHELCGLHEQLGDFRQAYAGALRLVREQTGDWEARERVERLASKAGLEEELVEAYDELLETPNLGAAAGLAMRETIAKLYQGPLRRPDDAIRAWEKVAKLDRAAVAPLEALKTLHEAARDWVRLGAVLQRLWPMRSTAAEQLAVLRQLADLADGPLHDKGLAADTYKLILERAPGDAVALRALGGLLDGFGRHGDAYAVLKQQLEVATGDEERAALSLKLGQLAIGPVGRAGEAVEHFARATSRDEAVRALELLLSREPSHSARIAAALEPVYRARGETRLLADMLALQPPARERLEELATLREAQKQPALAFAAREQLFALAPEDERLRGELERVARLSGHLETVASLFHVRLEHHIDEPERRALLQALGALNERLDRNRAAAEAFEELAKLTPRDPAPLEKLCALYRAEGLWARLPALLRARAELAAETERQVALLLEVADVCEQKLADDAAAVDASRAAVDHGGPAGPALANLERLLEKSGRWAELRELLLQRAGELELQVRVALVEHRHLRDDGSALKRLVAVVARDADALPALLEMMRAERPSSAAAARAVEAREPPRAVLIEALEVQAEWASGAARTELLHRVADLHEGDAVHAFDALDRLLRDAPDDARALARLTTLAASAKFERGLARLLGDVAPAASRDTQRTMWPQLAKLRAATADPEGAVAAWRALLAFEPNDLAALVAASELVEAAGHWPELVELLERRAALVPTERTALLARIGAVQESRMKDAAAAYDTWRRVLELEPRDATALEHLDALATRLERWPELAEVLGRRIALGGDSGPLKLRLAKLRRTRLNNAAAALPLLGELLQDDPTHAGAQSELKSLADEQPGWEPAEDLLLNTYRRSKDHVHLAVLLDAAATRALKSAKRRALWLELADLRLSVDGDPSLAFLAMARAFRETPSDAALRARLGELAAQANEEEAFGALLDEVLPQLEGHDAARASLHLAQLRLGLGDAEPAVTLLRRARELEPALSHPVLLGLDEALTALERWEELLEVLEEREAAAKGDVALLLRIGSVAADRLGRDERAIEAYRSVLAREPKHLEAARALEVLYERTGHRAALLDVLTLLEGLLGGAQRAQVRMKMARLCVKDDYERTLVLCRKLLEEDPLHAEGFALLAERLESGGRWAELDQVLEARLSVTLAASEAAELGFRLGSLAHQKRGDPKGAVRHLRGVLERAPQHEGALEALVGLYEQSGEKAELARVLATLAELRAEAEKRRPLLLRRAEVLAELGERDAAVEAVQAVLSAVEGRPNRHPETTSTPAPAAPPLSVNGRDSDLQRLQRLRAVTLKLEAWPEASQSLALLAAAQQPPEAIATLFELADVDGRRNHPEGAAAAVERILELEPSNRAAYERACALYANQPRPWARANARYLPYLAGAEKLTTLDTLVSTHLGPLKDPAGAFELAAQAVRLDPGSDARRATAEQLAKGLKKLDALVTVYRETLQTLAFGPAYTALALAQARLEDEGLGQVDAAEATLKGLLAHDPVNPPALDALAAMFDRRNLHAREVEALELKLEASSDTPARLELLERLAALHEQKLRDPVAAAHALQRRVDASPSPATARTLVDLHLRHRQWPEALGALARLRTLSPEAERAAVQLELAQLHETQLKDAEAAVEGYLQTLELDPLSSVAFRSLERLYTKLERPAELLRAYEHRIAATSSAEEKIELEYKSAALWEQRGNPLAADKCLSAVVALKPDAIEALEGLQRLRRAAGRWPPLAEALQKHAQVAPEPLQRATLLTELGSVEVEQLNDSAAAVRAWSSALEQVHDHRPALKALAALHEHEQRFADAAALLERDARVEPLAAERASLEHHRGVLLQDRLQNVAAARAAFAAALKAERLHLPALRRLRAIHFAAAEWGDYEASLALEAKSAPEGADRYTAALTLARHFASQQHAPEKAVPWYEHAFAVSPQSLEAALPLCDLLMAAKSYERAAVVLKAAVALLEHEPHRRTRELIDRLFALALAHRELMQPTLALHAYAKALHLDPVEPRVLRAQADLLEGGGHIEEAADKLELFLEHHGQTLLRSERAAMSLHLAEVYWKLKRERDALLSAERTLDLEATSVAALALAAKAADKLEAHEKAVQLKQRLADVSTDEVRFALLLELAAQAHQKLSNPLRAVEALLQAQKLKPQSREVWQALAAAYGALGHNRKAAEALHALLQHPESSAADKRRDTLQLADLHGRVMSEVDRAADVLERALDEAPQFVEAFQALEALLGRAKDWKKLDAVYSRHAVRLGANVDSAAERAALWRATGELRLKQFKDRAGALAAFEQGMRLVPDDVTALEAFAGLAIEFPDRVNDALQAYLRALPKSLDPQRACAAFARIAEKRGDLDTASIATRAAAMLSTSGSVGAMTPPKFKRPLDTAAWRQWLLHPLARGPLAELLALIWEHAGERYAPGLSDYKLHAKKHAVDPRTATHESLLQLGTVAAGLGFGPPELVSPYLAPQTSRVRESHPDDGVGVKVVPVWPPRVVVGERLLAEKNLPARYALIGRGLATLRPELLLAQLLDGDALELVVEAALTLGEPGYVSPYDPKVTKADKKQLEKAFSKAARAELEAVCARVLQGYAPGAVARFREGVRLTPLRVALLVAGDFAPVRAQIAFEGEHADAAVRELLVFALGGELHALRVAAGIHVEAR